MGIPQSCGVCYEPTKKEKIFDSFGKRKYKRISNEYNDKIPKLHRQLSKKDLSRNNISIGININIGNGLFAVKFIDELKNIIKDDENMDCNEYNILNLNELNDDEIKGLYKKGLLNYNKNILNDSWLIIFESKSVSLTLNRKRNIEIFNHRYNINENINNNADELLTNIINIFQYCESILDNNQTLCSQDLKVYIRVNRNSVSNNIDKFKENFGSNYLEIHKSKLNIYITSKNGAPIDDVLNELRNSTLKTISFKNDKNKRIKSRKSISKTESIPEMNDLEFVKSLSRELSFQMSNASSQNSVIISDDNNTNNDECILM